jgi:hypothetical protein
MKTSTSWASYVFYIVPSIILMLSIITFPLIEDRPPMPSDFVQEKVREVKRIAINLNWFIISYCVNRI